jgi:hypothetical protein
MTHMHTACTQVPHTTRMSLAQALIPVLGQWQCVCVCDTR